MAATREDLVEGRGMGGAQIALVLLGLVVLLAALWFVFLRDDAVETVAVPPPPVASPTPEPEGTSEPKRAGKGPLETFEVFAPKDPFRPLISEAAVTETTGATTVVGAPDGTTTAPGVGQPSGGSDISGDGTGTTGGGAGGNGGSDSVGGHRVRLIDTFRRNGEPAARVQVDGTVYTVQEGDRFAENFELLSVSGDCASMLYGDDEFSLCEGEEILK